MRENLGLKVDIYEKDNTIIVNAELPGIPEDVVSVNITGKLFTIGSKEEARKK